MRSQHAPMRTAAALAAVVSCALVLSGCAASVGTATPPPHPSATPLFRTDAQALAAAKAAYAKYLAVSNRVGEGGWADPSQLKAVERGSALAEDLSAATSYISKGWRQTGDGQFDSLRFEQRSSESGVTTVTAFLCLDASAVDVVDGSGSSVVPSTRPDRVPLEVTFDDFGHRGHLVLSRSKSWSGPDFC